jgi:hypothetical protein
MTKVLPSSGKADEEDGASVASSSVHSECADLDKEAELEAAKETVRKRSKFINARNQLRDNVLKEVLAAVMPDIGSYDIDGIGKRATKEKSKLKHFLKFLGLLDLDLHEAVLTGSVYYTKRAINNIIKPGKGKSPDPSMMNQYDEQGRTPLCIAVRIMHSEIVLDLLENEALPDVCDEATGRTPLMFSVMNRTMDITKTLLKYNASVDMPDFQCITPLMLACANKDIKHCELLCSKLAEVDAQDENGWTPLHYAALNNAPKCIVLLLSEGANRALRDNNRRRPLDIARWKDHGECIAILSSSKAYF